MPEVAAPFRRFASSYVAAHGAAMLPSHRRAIADIIACRTEALGGQQWCCNHCGTLLHVFHSCRNRACPKGHAEQTQARLEQRPAASSGAATTAAPCCRSPTPAATAPARSVTPSRRRLGSNSVGRRCYRFPISTSPSPCPKELRAALRRYQIDGYGALMKA